MSIIVIVEIVILIILSLRKTKYQCINNECVKSRSGYNSLEDCQSDCSSKKYVCRDNNCVIANPTETGYDTLQKCKEICAPLSTSCYYWNGNACVQESPCTHGPTGYSTQQKCLDHHKTCYYWDSKQCVRDDTCLKTPKYTSYSDCTKDHSDAKKFYSFDQYGKCLENNDCEETSDRNFCVNTADCKGAPLFDHSKYSLDNLKPSNWTTTKLKIMPATTNRKAGLPFDTSDNGLPVIAYDHQCHMSLTQLDGDYGITVTYGIACKHQHDQVDCSTQDDADCKYGGQFWTKSIINADEAIVTYDMQIPVPFDPVHGGKLPGIFGIDSDSSISDHSCGRCTGSNPSNGAKCWSARPMWRAGFFGEVLLVVPIQPNGCDHNLTPEQTNKGSIHNPGGSLVACDESWGCGLARGAFRWPMDSTELFTVGMYVKMNTIGNKDGKFYFFLQKKSEANPTLVFYYDDIIYRVSDKLQISGILFSTFFGGGSPAKYQPREKLSITFSNFKFSKA